MKVGKKPDKLDRRVRIDEQELKEILFDMFDDNPTLSFEEIE